MTEDVPKFDTEGINKHDKKAIKRAEWFASLIANDGTKYRVLRSQSRFDGKRNVDYFITPMNSKEILSRVSIRPSLKSASAKFHSYQTKRGYKRLGFNRILERFLDQEVNSGPFLKTAILETKENMMKKYKKRGWERIDFTPNIKLITMRKKIKSPVWKGAKAVKARRKRK